MLTGKNHGFRLLQKEESAGQTNETTGVPLLDASMAQPRTVVNHTERREAWMCFAELRVDFSGGLVEGMKKEAERDCLALNCGKGVSHFSSLL